MGKAKGGLCSSASEAIAAAEHGKGQTHGAAIRKAIALKERPDVLIFAHIARGALHQDRGERIKNRFVLKAVYSSGVQRKKLAWRGRIDRQVLRDHLR